MIVVGQLNGIESSLLEIQCLQQAVVGKGFTLWLENK